MTHCISLNYDQALTMTHCIQILEFESDHNCRKYCASHNYSWLFPWRFAISNKKKNQKFSYRHYQLILIAPRLIKLKPVFLMKRRKCTGEGVTIQWYERSNLSSSWVRFPISSLHNLRPAPSLGANYSPTKVAIGTPTHKIPQYIVKK